MVEFLEVKTERQIQSVALLAAAIWHAHYDPLLADGQVDYMLGRFQSPEAIAEAIRTDGYRYWLTRIDGSEVGYFATVDEADGSVFLSKLYVLSWARGHGYGKECVAFVCDRARRGGNKRVWLTVNKENTGSIAAYKKMGFTVFDQKKTDIGGGYVMDDYFMEKPL